MNNDFEKINIDSEDALVFLINRFFECPGFAKAFVFSNDDLYKRFFNSVDVDLDLFHKNFYYFDKEKNIHISESERGYVWISTLGLVATQRVTTNKYVNAFLSQEMVLSLLLDEIIEICNNENCYDIDSALYARLEILTPTIFHHIVFFYETFAKAYLSLNNVSFSKTHKLKNLFELTINTMKSTNQDNTLFHRLLLPSFQSMVEHIKNISGDFKEQFIKYDDNSQDTTFIIYNINDLISQRDIVKMGLDAILDLYYCHKKSIYMHKVKSKEGENIDRTHAPR